MKHTAHNTSISPIVMCYLGNTNKSGLVRAHWLSVWCCVREIGDLVLCPSMRKINVLCAGLPYLLETDGCSVWSLLLSVEMCYVGVQVHIRGLSSLMFFASRDALDGHCI